MIATKSALETLSDSSRIWIYQADRKLTDEESVYVETETARFIEGWNAHGKQLCAAFDFFHNQFLVLAVDESVHAASGCSIDTSVGLIRHLNDRFGVDFLDRRKVAFWKNDQVVLIDLTAIKESIASGIIDQHTLVFNNLQPTLGDLRGSWKVPAKESWLKRYFN